MLPCNSGTPLPGIRFSCAKLCHYKLLLLRLICGADVSILIIFYLQVNSKLLFKSHCTIAFISFNQLGFMLGRYLPNCMIIVVLPLNWKPIFIYFSILKVFHQIQFTKRIYGGQIVLKTRLNDPFHMKLGPNLNLT